MNPIEYYLDKRIAFPGGFPTKTPIFHSFHCATRDAKKPYLKLAFGPNLMRLFLGPLLELLWIKYIFELH